MPLEKIRWKVGPVVDAHAHFDGGESLRHFYTLHQLVNYTGANLMAVPGARGKDELTWVRDRKNEYPEYFSIFGCMLHDPAKVAAHDGRDLPRQIDALVAAGFDGLKMLEGKPALRKHWMPLKLDDAYFEPFFAKAEQDRLPLTLHVSDPIEMWRSPAEGPTYGDLDPQDEFIRQAVAVLERHPNLRVNFPHFFYLSPQLERLSDLFGRFPHILTDLAMGDEFLYYGAADPQKMRDFFIRHEDRIMYGTDLHDRNSLWHGRAKAELLRLFLETDGPFENIVHLVTGRAPRVYANGAKTLHGLNLPDRTLRKVLGGNCIRWTGRSFTPLPADAAEHASTARVEAAHA
ncbi:MAG: amidohydrolase family protein [Planctomycetota bacterium]